ncbi:MAG: MarR family transcriptional regulator [Pseudonocardia sp.]|nr:MarR family transcriptional regulator [Pseudonocardia sp.]
MTDVERISDGVAGPAVDGRARFVEQFALDWSREGFPRMSARVFAAILISEEGRLSAVELGELLDVSAAAVSGAVRHLTGVGLVARERERGSRRDHYRLLDDVWYESFSRADERFGSWAATLALAVDAVEPGSDAQRRLDDARLFFLFLRERFPQLMASWKERHGERNP